MNTIIETVQEYEFDWKVTDILIKGTIQLVIPYTDYFKTTDWNKEGQPEVTEPRAMFKILWKKNAPKQDEYRNRDTY